MVENVRETVHKSVERAVKRFFSKRFFSISTVASVVLVAFVVLVFVTLHPFSESWAHEIATALITVDGLILGFTILGVTVIIKRGFSTTRMTAIFEKHFKEFINELKVVEASDVKKMAEKIASTAVSALVDILSVPYTLFSAMYFLFASLLLAFMLFGVSDNTVGNPIFVSVFQSVMGLSILFLILGFHLTIKVLQDLTMKTSPKELFKAFEEAIRGIEQDSKGTTNTKKE